MKKVFFPVLCLLILSNSSCISMRSAQVSVGSAHATEDTEPMGALSIWTASSDYPGADTLRLSITLKKDGRVLGQYKNGDWWSSIQDLRLELPPGKYELVAEHQSWSYTSVVPVEPGRITFASFRRQNLSRENFSSTNSIYTHTYYNILPGSCEESIPLAFTLDDVELSLASSDWGIRHHALLFLRKRKAAPPSRLHDDIARLAREDPVAFVRYEGNAILKKFSIPAPPPPLYFESFEHNTRKLWPFEDNSSKRTKTWFADGGYFMSNESNEDRWTTIPQDWLGEHGQRVDIVLDCFQLMGTDNRLFGLAIGESNNAMLFCGLSAAGEASIWEYAQGRWLERLPWTRSAQESIAAMRGGRIEVQLRDRKLRLLVNGTEIGSIEHSLHLVRAGVSVAGNQTVLFHRLQARLPQD